MPARPRVLVVTHRLPYPPDKGDRIRTYHTLRELAKHADIWLLALADEPAPAEHAAKLRELCERVEVVPLPGGGRWQSAVWSALRGRSLSEGFFASQEAWEARMGWMLDDEEFDAGLASASSIAVQLQGGPLSVGNRKFVDFVDVDSAKWSDYADAARGPKRWLYRLEGRRVAKLEREIGTWASAVAVVSDAEAAVLREAGHPGPVVVAPNGVDLDYWRPAAEPAAVGCAFVGVMDYRPNIDAVTWFAREVWPEVRRRSADARFTIIGRNPTAAVRRLGGGGVDVLGGVPDVRPHLDGCAVSVAPLRLGRGVQNKVLESMAMAKPVVASSRALAGIPCEPGQHVVRANTPDEWVGAISALFADPARRAELGANARRYVEEHHRWDQCLRPLLDAVVPPGEVP